MRWIVQVAQYVFEAIGQVFNPLRDEFPRYGFEAFSADLPDATTDWPQRPACRITCPLK
ncbi:hypothetical protein [Gloeobacter kilaueensis]|uniref:Uncharacterized protein n=1 Tax=Gloeobacter kilaueensis (strain ATCC BAA-2537 / CCAP 1431/1 / ULC 316 / JS1) TaxID=1183438 RepID=U5QQW6_GLOK1|nr:hypothetical protein [Gloeobacter kilaueensis]AGY60105.1 hypothetical protein GKIL_3859 [Gloeobacter kilaueensis JS1]